MKFKHPKKLRIGSTVFKVKYDYGFMGASFDYGAGVKPNIIFGLDGVKENPGLFLELVMHELTEILHHEQSTRLFNPGTDGFEFHYCHKEHQAVCSNLAGLLTKFIR